MAGRQRDSAVVTFASADAFRTWLEEHHARATELTVRCFKTHARHQGLGYKEALDEALCFGWIDGVRHGLDDRSYCVRFSPRKKKSIWSQVNIRRATTLEAEGRMHHSGLAAFHSRTDAPSGYSFEHRGEVSLAPEFLAKFQGNRRAWSWFQSQAPSYRRTSVFWVMSAKKEETRARRFDVLLKTAAQHAPVPPLQRPAGKTAARRRTPDQKTSPK